MNSNYQICNRCVHDNASPRIYFGFDENGICDNCHAFDKLASEKLYIDDKIKNSKLEIKINKIKEEGKKKPYDCILGISGGMDSSYLAYLAKKYELRPLFVHFDNGWDSEIAVMNIQNIVSKLGVDLYTYVINWEEFKDLQLAFLKASVIDIEVPTDQFIYATLQEIAYKNKIKYVLDGNNIATEFWGSKTNWGYSKVDLVNLNDIHRKHGTIKLNKFPKLGFYERYLYNQIFNIESVYLLNYINYNRKEVIDTLEKEFNWKNPGIKHYESIFTRFYQGYILPKKFNIDKRKNIFSNLIWSGQITREQAIEMLKLPPYPIEEQEKDKEYVLKKFGLSITEFDEIMQKPIVEHNYYLVEEDFIKNHQKFQNIMYPIIRFIKKFRLMGLAKPFLLALSNIMTRIELKKISK